MYRRMPELLKKHRHVLQMRVIACCNLEGQFDEALRAYRVAAPDDPGIDIFLTNYYALHRQFDDMLACVDRLDRAVGGDPLLDAYRAVVHTQIGNLAAAKKCAQNAAAAEPASGLASDALKMVLLMEKNSPAVRPVDPSTLPETSPGEPAGDAEARAFAEAFEKSVMSGDVAAIQAGVDNAALIRRSLAELKIPEGTRIGVEGALKLGGVNIADVFTNIHAQIEHGASFRLLHLRRDAGEQRVLFRLVNPSGGIGYLDCFLVRHADGKVRIDDVYSFELGQMLSDVQGRPLLLAGENLGKAPGAAVAGPGNDGIRLSNAWSEMRKRIKAGEYQEALDVYRSLPEHLQKEKLVLITRIQAARRLKGKPYDEAVIAYRKTFPNEPNLDLIMIYAYHEHKLFDKVLASIDGLDRTVGGDPFLDVLRADTYFEKGDLAAAKRCAGSRSRVSRTCRQRMSASWRFRLRRRISPRPAPVDEGSGQIPTTDAQVGERSRLRRIHRFAAVPHLGECQ